MTDDNDSTDQDLVWKTAWSWVVRQHEVGGLDASAQVDFSLWLVADPAHRRGYDRASHIWLLTGLLPPQNDIDLPDCPESEGD